MYVARGSHDVPCYPVQHWRATINLESDFRTDIRWHTRNIGVLSNVHCIANGNVWAVETNGYGKRERDVSTLKVVVVFEINWSRYVG